MIKFVISFLASVLFAGAAFAAPEAQMAPTVRGYVFEGSLKDVRDALKISVVNAGYVRTEETEIVVGWVTIPSGPLATLRRQSTYTLKPSVAQKVIITETSRFEMKIKGAQTWEPTYPDVGDYARVIDLFDRVEYVLAKRK